MIVPWLRDSKVTTDGIFSPGEWENALTVPMSKEFTLCLFAQAEDLCIGLRSAKPTAIMVSEIYFTTDDKEYYNLHSSDRLGEGARHFGEDPNFKVGVTKGWSANVNSFNPSRLKEWEAAGRPLDLKRYGDIYAKSGGREYRISLKKLAGARLRVKVGFMYLRDGEKANLDYPDNSSYGSSDGWIDLFLPSSLSAPNGGPDSVWYLGHCGFAVRTASHFLIFDYQELRDGPQSKSKPSNPSLENGWINPDEIKNLRVLVFASHSHDDHFDPVVFEWEKTIPDIQYFFGWKAADDTSFHYLVGPRAEYKSGGLEIATINSHHSGVPEVAWLVKVDGLVIYHNGDCQPDNAVAEYAFLQTKADRIDLAFLPPVYEEKWKYSAQNLELFRRFSPRLVFPMHAAAGSAKYAEVAQGWKVQVPGLRIAVPARMGDQFEYHKEKSAK